MKEALEKKRLFVSDATEYGSVSSVNVISDDKKIFGCFPVAFFYLQV